LPHFNSDGNGVVYVATDLACAQSAAGESVTCIGGKNGSLTELLQGRGVATHIVPEFASGVSFNLRALPRLWRLLKTLRPQVVHAHTIPIALTAKLLQAFLGFRLVTTVHNGPRLRNLLLAVGDRCICVSGAVADSMKRLAVSDRKIRIVRNGPLGSPRRSLAIPAPFKIALRKPAILAIAGLHRYKGIEDLIEAFAIAKKSVPDLSMYILGEGPARAQLEMRAASLGCSDRIHFKGFVDDPRPYLTQSDVFVLPSHREAFGLALAEAREAGCAVIGTNVGGIAEVLEGGRAGILVPPKNPDQLSRILVQLFADQAILAAWQKRASTNLSWLHLGRVAQETMEIYRELLISVDQPNHATARTNLTRAAGRLTTISDAKVGSAGGRSLRKSAMRGPY